MGTNRKLSSVVSRIKCKAGTAASKSVRSVTISNVD
jgi:hypothetical protein